MAETSENNVWASSANNAYQSVLTASDTASATNVSTNETHTRIYEYLASTIELDEMSIPLHDDIDSNMNIDPSTGQHTESSNENSDPFQTTGNQSPSKQLSIGVQFPLLRVNDHYFTDHDIKYFSLSSAGLIP